MTNLRKPLPEEFGWHKQEGPEDEPSGWLLEDGEHQYSITLQAWEIYQNWLNFVESIAQYPISLETQQYLDILKTKKLTNTEQKLLEINLELMKTPDRPHLNLEFVRKEGEDGVKRLMTMVAAKEDMKKLLTISHER